MRAPPRVVTGHQGDIRDLFEGLAPCLAGLELHQVEQLRLPVEDEVVVAQQDPLAQLEGVRAQLALGRPGRVDGHHDVLGCRQRQGRQRGATEGRVRDAVLGARRHR